MTKSIHWLIAMTFLIFAFVGCSNGSGLDDLLGEYNSNFTMPNTQTQRDYTEPGDDEFDPSKMLLENYFVIDTGCFVVAGPMNCLSYNWKIAKTSELGTELPVHLIGDLNTSSREFAVYIPRSGLDVGSYRLTLTIVSQDGKEYTDTCRLVVYTE